jgi:hypothetical protein
MKRKADEKTGMEGFEWEQKMWIHLQNAILISFHANNMYDCNKIFYLVSHVSVAPLSPLQ